MKRKILFGSLAIITALGLKAQNIPTTATAPAGATALKLPPVFGSTPTANYLRAYTPQVPQTDLSQINMTKTVEEVMVTTSFSDSYGRTQETVTRQASPLKKDNVAAAAYDEFGRSTVNYMPFVSTGNDGAFKTNPFYQDSVFYKSLFPDERVYYSQTLYDGSPMNLPVKSMAPGNSWGGAGVGISYNHRSNTVADSVVLWTIDISSEDDVPVKTAFYGPGTLAVKEETDERGIKAIEYTNQLGQTVLTKTQLSNTPGTAHVGWLCTYYVYDEAGRLRMVIPPKATEAINVPVYNWSLTANTDIHLNLCYAYYYDSRGRNIMKRIPGKGKSYIAYDLYDRAVMTQDPNLRSASQWAFVLYDAQSRPVKSGVITTALIKDSIFSQAARSLAYPTLSGTYTVTSEAYYDNYDWVSSSGSPFSSTIDGTHINGTNFITSYNSAPLYAQQQTQSKRTKGFSTGNKSLILKTSNYLHNISYFDHHGRIIQNRQSNYSGGVDVATVQYSFTGKRLRSHLYHYKAGNNAQSHTMLTKYSYDHAGRLLNLVKNFDGLGDKTIRQHQYNELGQLKTNIIGSSIETQEYAYNIRGWMQGINKDHVNNSNPAAWFGETISYDYGFTNSILNGNKAGIKWRAAGDSNVRAYGYSYDNSNRLVHANYSQQNSGSTAWTKDKADFTVSNMHFDANGNMQSMSQRGLLLGSSALIDSLSYQYFAHSNRLQKVNDLATAGGNLGDFKDSTSSGDDYTYDANGNINRDNNRHMHNGGNAGAVFNLLDKADSIVIAGKATTYYYYDAGGAMLGKKVNSYTPAGLVVKNYQYLGGFVYLNDTLQYALMEGGRIRYAQKRNSTTGALYYAYEYDYFISDHMGNVRTTLTEGKDTLSYQATMEPARTAVEDALFTNIYSPVYTVGNKPAGFDSDGANTQVSVLNASSSINKKMGPGLVLKVMKGDQVQLNTYAFYNTATQAPDPGVNILPDLLNTLTGGVIGSSGGKVLPGQSSALASVLSPNMADFLNNDRSYDNSRPKAYLNWVLFDNQFNFVAGSSGVVQVLSGSSKQALVAPLQTIAKNGYLYVYVSNESPQNVYFDDVTVTHYTGPLLQEQAYYPYGLPMQGLSDRAMLKTGNPYKYNDGSELEDEDGLEYYNTFYRKYDAQIGRFTGVDILAEATYGFTPFHFGGNNPTLFNDPNGALMAADEGRARKGPDGNYHAPWVANMLWNDKGFYSLEDLGYNYSGGGGSYFSLRGGISSQTVLDQMGFGGKFAINKNGEYGFWVGNPFDPTQRGYQEAGAGVWGLQEVSVGTTRLWQVLKFENIVATVGAVDFAYSMWESQYDHTNYPTTRGKLKPIYFKGEYRSARAARFGFYSKMARGSGFGISTVGNVLGAAQVYQQYQEGGFKNINPVDAAGVTVGTTGLVANAIGLTTISKATGYVGVAIQSIQMWQMMYQGFYDLSNMNPTTGNIESDRIVADEWDKGIYNWSDYFNQ